MNYFMGIDPGKHGAFAVLNENGTPLIYEPFPLIGSALDLVKLKNKLSLTIDLYMERTVAHNNGVFVIAIEDVHSIFGASAKSNFTFGHICGFLECCITGAVYHKVKPKEWQKIAWNGIEKQFKTSKGRKVSDTKKNSLIAVNRLFPEADLLATRRSKVPHDGIVDALLITEYCRRIYNK